MLLHTMALWPSAIIAEFWSYAFKQAALIHNVSPRRGEKESPYTKFTNEDNTIQPSDLRVFGCPVYVLEKDLQDGNNHSKWKVRAHQGIYVGHSPNHASNVVLVYNPVTKLVSPQYIVVFDEGFETVSIQGQEQDTSRLDLMLANVLPDAFWLHSDQFKDEEVQHYYFDTAWDQERMKATSKKVSGQK